MSQLTTLLRPNTARTIAWVYTVCILLLVALPLNGEGQLLGNLNDNYVMEIRLDYLSHALLFIPWVLVGGYGWELHHRNRIRIGLSYLLALTFAAFCEYLQLLLPYRTFNINDLVSNALGVTLGFLLLWAWFRSGK
ncbi:VanZ family protein [Larkinella punicea]|uniref:VanZ family protein n=1 Tax=Larkinella punicea TaxID=2315727 RepID=A0A368JKN3_9BACT|nr:VanZ family protein [Larkinella punicea]RCR67606.1 VanZ family protein [Larkinella punicea]